MKNITSIVITEAMLTSSTIAEPLVGVETEWNGATDYAIGQECIRAALHRKFTRKVAGTTATAPESDPNNWEDTGATMKWAMFDLSDSQQSVATGAQTVVITPGKRITSIGITGLQAAKVRIKVDVGATNYYDQEIKTSLRHTTGWLDYLLGGFRYVKGMARFNLPPVTGAKLTITFTGSTIKVGRIFIGTSVDIGKVERDASGDVTDYSLAKRSDFGTAKLVKRPIVPKATLVLKAKSSQVNKLRELREDSAGKVTLWCGMDDDILSDWFDLFLIAGKWNRFVIGPHPAVKSARINLEIEEV